MFLPRITKVHPSRMTDLTLSILVVVITLLFVLWIQQAKKQWIKFILDWFPAILFAYVIPALFTHISGKDLSAGLIHQFSRNWLLPFTVLAVMSALSMKELRIVGIKPILLFVIGSMVIATLPVLLVLFFELFDSDARTLFIQQGFWKGLTPIVGGWIGGSTSQLVLKEVTETPESLFLSILVLDNILVNIWTILMFQFIKRSDQINRLLKIYNPVPIVEPHSGTSQMTSHSILLTVGIIVGGTVLSVILQWQFLTTIIILSFAGLVLGNTLKFWNHKLVLKISTICILLIMAILGLKLNFSNLTLPFIFIGLVLLWLILHFIIMLVASKILKLNVAWVAIGSMANLGGISTAPAVTSAYKKELMPHAILLAILSMVTGTSWGLLTIGLFRLM